MRKIIIITIIAIGMLGVNRAQAQKVIKAADGGIYIDVQDMLAGSFSTSTLNIISKSTDMQRNNTYKKIQIAKNDMEMMTWTAAIGLSSGYNTIIASGNSQGSASGCKLYSAEGNAGKWRLPTQSELLLMYALKDPLETVGLTFGAVYWSSCESSDNEAWYVRMNLPLSYTSLKTTSNQVRCVREVN